MTYWIGRPIVIILAAFFTMPAFTSVLYSTVPVGTGVGGGTNPDKDVYTSVLLSFGVWNTGAGCSHKDTGLNGPCAVVFNKTVTLADVGETIAFNSSSASFRNSVDVVRHPPTFNWDAAATWPPPRGGAEILYSLNQPAVSGYIQSFDLHLDALCFSTNESCSGGTDDSVIFHVTINGEPAPEPACWASILLGLFVGGISTKVRRELSA